MIIVSSSTCTTFLDVPAVRLDRRPSTTESLSYVADHLDFPLSVTYVFFTIDFGFVVRDAKATKYDAFRAPEYEIGVSVPAQGLERLPVTISGTPAAAVENTCKTLGRRNTPFATKK